MTVNKQLQFSKYIFPLLFMTKKDYIWFAFKIPRIRLSVQETRKDKNISNLNCKKTPTPLNKKHFLFANIGRKTAYNPIHQVNSINNS